MSIDDKFPSLREFMAKTLEELSDEDEVEARGILAQVRAAHPSASPTKFDLKGVPLTPEVLAQLEDLRHSPGPPVSNSQRELEVMLRWLPRPPVEEPRSRVRWPGFAVSISPHVPNGMALLVNEAIKPPTLADVVFDEAASISPERYERLWDRRYGPRPVISPPPSFVLITNIGDGKRKRHRRQSTMRLKHYSRLLRKRANRARSL